MSLSSFRPERVDSCLSFSAGKNIPVPCTNCDGSRACGVNPRCSLVGNVPVTITTKPCAAFRNVTLSCENAAKMLGIWENGQTWESFFYGGRCAIGEEGFCVLTNPAPQHKLDCCLGRTSNPIQCNGKWCPNTCREDAVVRDYCTTGSNMLLPECAQFCPRGTTVGRSSWCDNTAIRFCNSGNTTNAATSFCACINSGIPRPACFDSKCTATGYQTAAQLKETDNCGQVCQQIVECIQDGSCTVDQNTFTINCPNIPYPNGNNRGDTSANLIALRFPNHSSETIYEILGLVGGILMLIILIGLIIYVIKESQ